MYRKKNQVLGLVICIIDAIVIVLGLLLAGILRYGDFESLRMWEDIRLTCGAIVLLHVALFYFTKVIDEFFRRGRYRELLFCIRYNVLLTISLVFFGFAIKNSLMISRLMMGYSLVINTIFLWITHVAIKNRERVFRWGNIRKENLLIVTTSDRVEEIVHNFISSKEILWTISGIILTDINENVQKIGDIPVLSISDDYFGFAAQHVVDEVFIQISDIQKSEKILKHMILTFENMGLVVNLNLDLFDLGFSGEKRIYPLEGYNVVAFSSRLLDYRMILLKRVMDIVGALIGLCITIPIGLVLAPILWLESPGPLIFKQRRIGRNGREFDFYKFRSMYNDAESRKQELLDQNEMAGPMFKIEDDPRITKVGKFIRRTSIDELPQFWNVLRGDMSLVGTRPPTVDEFQQYDFHQRRRMSFRPGITGLWQVSGRSGIKDFDDVVKLDLEYIDNWSIALDIKIICKTIIIVFSGCGAV